MNNNHKGIECLIVIMAFVFGLFFISYAAEPKPFTKSQAAQLLSSMGYKDVEVGAIVLGLGQQYQENLSGDRGMVDIGGGQNIARVLAIGREKDGKPQRIILTFYYDTEIGWFYHVYDDKKLRMWTLSGYKEFRPKQTEGAGK